MENNNYVAYFRTEEGLPYIKKVNALQLFFLMGQEMHDELRYLYLVTENGLEGVGFLGKYHNAYDMLRMEIRDQNGNLIEACYAEEH